MSDYYLDASALVKRYIDENGSDWIRQITKPSAQNTILIAEITLAEIAAALGARHRASKGITREERDRALSRFLEDCDELFLLLPVDRPVIDRAVELTQNYRLRGYDAVQLATTLVTSDLLESQSLPSLVIVTADTDLNFAAAAEGLPVENPLNHE